MCYGNLDPKYTLREAEGRLKGIARAVETQEASVQAPGLWARLRTAFARWNWKEATDV